MKIVKPLTGLEDYFTNLGLRYESNDGTDANLWLEKAILGFGSMELKNKEELYLSFEKMMNKMFDNGELKVCNPELFEKKFGSEDETKKMPSLMYKSLFFKYDKNTIVGFSVFLGKFSSFKKELLKDKKINQYFFEEIEKKYQFKKKFNSSSAENLIEEFIWSKVVERLKLYRSSDKMIKMKDEFFELFCKEIKQKIGLQF